MPIIIPKPYVAAFIAEVIGSPAAVKFNPRYPVGGKIVNSCKGSFPNGIPIELNNDGTPVGLACIPGIPDNNDIPLVYTTLRF